MTYATLVLRGLSGHWRSHLGVLLGGAIGSAVLVGALVVGDSVRYSLQRMALLRLGETQVALVAGDRLFRDQLAGDLSSEMNAPAAPVLLLTGSASRSDSKARANGLQVLGVDERFARFAGDGPFDLPVEHDEVVLNERLARQLGVAAGDRIVLRVDKPSALSRDAPLSDDKDAVAKLAVRVKAVAPDLSFARFGLQANQVPPYNAFVPLRALQGTAQQPGRANLLLLGGQATVESATQALQKTWTLADAQLELRELPKVNALELRSSRIFIDPPAAQAAFEAAPNARGILTYFVNELRLGERATPYAMVAAMGAPIVPDSAKDGEILLNAWCADDLQAKAGDTVAVTYFVMGPQRKLKEVSTTFKVGGIVPLEGAAADPELMPEYPGISHVDDCKQWSPGFPLDLDRIRDKDEQYWDDHRGTPKAFVTLKQGRELWNNRFGEYTAIRYPLEPGALDRIAQGIREKLDPRLCGLTFLPVREQAMNANTQAMDFGGLFIGFSFFLIVAALILMGLLFQFGIERRAEEAGVLLALGIPVRKVRRLFLLEGLALSLAGGVLGAIGGVFYARAMLLGLQTLWVDAVQTRALLFAAQPGTLLGGALAASAVAFFVIWLRVRTLARQPARELLHAGAAVGPGLSADSPRSRGFWIAGVCFAAAVGMTAWAGPRRDAAAAGVFFGAGALLLIAGVALQSALLARWARKTGAQLSAAEFNLRNAARRRGRSLAALGLLACGIFLVVAVGANRQDPSQGAWERSSGTGGFALFARASVPILHDLNTPAGREACNLEEDELTQVRFVPLRVHGGDDASCLNLNRAQSPQLWGVKATELAEREAFTFSSVLGGVSSVPNPWLLLNDRSEPDVMPAIGDMNTVLWGLGSGVGKTLDYTDERGRSFKVKIVATLATSMLQGGLIVDENALVARYPSEAGYRILLIDAPSQDLEDTASALAEAMEDSGLEIKPATRKLAEFMAVQETYLSTFQILGGLGMLLGSAGLGVLVLRNVLERRGELALLRAVGFTRRKLRGLVAAEHAALLLGGLCCGVLAAGIAVLPALRTPGADIPYASLAMTLAAVLASGALWTWLAAAWALRGNLLAGLRQDE